MPIFPEVGWMVQNQPTMSELAQRALDLKGQLPLQQVDPHMALGVTVDDWTQPEYLWLKRTRQNVFCTQVAASVGNFQALLVGFPALAAGQLGSIAVIEKIVIANNTAGGLILHGVGLINTLPFTLASIVNSARDSRHFDDRTTLLGGISNSAAQRLPAGNQIFTVAVQAGDTVVIENPGIILTSKPAANGNQVQFGIEQGVVNQPLSVSMFWRERPMLSSEV